MSIAGISSIRRLKDVAIVMGARRSRPRRACQCSLFASAVTAFRSR